MAKLIILSSRVPSSTNRADRTRTPSTSVIWTIIIYLIVFVLDIDWYFYFLTLTDKTWIQDPQSGKQYTDLKKIVYSREQAKELCHAVGGKLPEPRDYNENKFLNSLGTNTFFLGLTKPTTAYGWNWIWVSDRSQMRWSIWNPVRGWQHCAYMKRNTVRDSWDKYRWSSVDCWRRNVPRTAVCEKKSKLID